jgi:predicted metalloprotease with PDZ domain
VSTYIRYKIQPGLPATRLIHIEMHIENVQENTLEIRLPVWRPGRYEMGNFAKNIQQIGASGAKEKSLPIQKLSSHAWEIICGNETIIVIRYSYYAAELNAGSTYLDDFQLYINPVNCCLYIPQRMHEPCELSLHIPLGWQIATALQAAKNNHFVAESFDRLADSPIIAAKALAHQQITVSRHTIHLWFCGEVQPDWKKLKTDFKAFVKAQLDMMGALPEKVYHFLFQILPYPFYHGVEHLNSTVCALGPGYKLFQPALYRELLGVSSHELFHAWNIKFIRPADMQPYDFSRENYSRLGWVYEGITTYYGDQLLIRSGVFSATDFLITLNDKLKKHTTSYGRLNQSVAEASFDTWLDGYTAGIPHRKSSIYTEGSLVAFILDMKIREFSKDNHSLDDFMRALLKETKSGKGYDRQLLIDLLQHLCGKQAEQLYSSLVETAGDLSDLLAQAGKRVGLKLEQEAPFSVIEHRFGCLLDEGSTDQVKLVAPGSPAEKAGLAAGDQIIAVNGLKNRQQIKTMQSEGEKLTLHVFSADRLRELVLTSSAARYFLSARFSAVKQPDLPQKKAWLAWTGHEHPAG